MQLRISTDLLAGLLFLAIGSIGVTLGVGYSVGSVDRIGAGFFPVMVSGVLAALGLVLTIRAGRIPGEQVGEVDPRPLLILVGAALFGLLVEDIGFPLAGLILVVIARVAGRSFRLVETLLLGVGLVAACTLIFAYFLGLNLPHTRLW